VKLLTVLTISLLCVACECKAENVAISDSYRLSDSYAASYHSEPSIHYLYNAPRLAASVVGYWTIIEGYSTFYTLDKRDEAFTSVEIALKAYRLKHPLVQPQ